MKEHFSKLCGESTKQKTARFTRKKFVNYLSQRYGPEIAEKIGLMIDFSQIITFTSFVDQLVSILKSRDLMMQMIFDIYDSNNDDKISQLDVFKVVHTFNQTPNEEKFAEIMYQDIV